MNDYTVNLHVHTTYSDGRGTMAEVVSAARRAGLSVLLVTDHDSLAGRDAGWEGWHDGLLVLVGWEVSGPHNHLLVFGTESTFDYSWQRPQEAIDRVKAAGGVCFIAHPFEKGSPMDEGGHAYTWRDWTVEGFDGLEIWNYSSSWKARAQSMASGIFHFALHSWTLNGPETELKAKWDQLGKTRRVAGVGGSDVHAFRHRALGREFTIFPYEDAFRAVNTHVLLPGPLTGNLDEDRRLVLGALASGSCFVAHDRLQESRGFDWWVESDGARRAGQGEETAWREGDTAVFGLPAHARCRLLRDGGVIAETVAAEGRVPLQGPGVYRLEAEIRRPPFGWRPWLYANPIYLR